MDKKRKGVRKADFEGWGKYMTVKKQKLEAQFNEDVSEEKQWKEFGCTNLFKGVSIFVNGYTKPCASELKRLMQLHGGSYCHYYSHSHTSHIIATNLASSKIHSLQHRKIVHPDWITESIKQGKLLPYESFSLYKPEVLKGQRQLNVKSSFQSTGRNKFVDSLSSDETYKIRESFCNEEQDIKHSASITNVSLSTLKASDALVCNKVANFSSNSNFVESHLYGQNTLNNETLCYDSAENCVSTSSIHHHFNKTNTKGSLNAGEANFLSEFYNHSRLHHISSAGIELRDYVIKLHRENTGELLGKKRLHQWKETQIKVQPDDKFTSHKDKSSICNNKFNPLVVNFRNSQRISKDVTKQNIIMHIDMDCFFVSVGLRKHLELIGKPVAVTHSRGGHVMPNPEADPEYELKYYQQKIMGKAFEDNESLEDNAVNFNKNERCETITTSTSSVSPKYWGSTSEISCCSYEARKAGVCNGMFLGQALKLCPDLQTIPYEFEEYRVVSKLLYDIVASYTLCIEAVSCDEMFVDCTSLLNETGATPEEFAAFLREEINLKTGCTASAGLANNKLLARLATKAAKPNGHFYLEVPKVDEFMKVQKVKDLPGVGRSTAARLESMGILTCGQLQLLPLGKLKQTFGPKIGQILYNHCRGFDDRMITIEKERKSVSAEINYGIRFQQEKEVHDFLQELSAEVQSRLDKINMKGRLITLKLKVRSKNAPVESFKFMGHGVCDSISKSTMLPFATSDKKVIGKQCISLLKITKIIPQDLRGIGIQIGRLEICSVKNLQPKTLAEFIRKNPLDINIRLGSTQSLSSASMHCLEAQNLRTANNSLKTSWKSDKKEHLPSKKKIANPNVDDLNSLVLRTESVAVNKSKVINDICEKKRLKTSPTKNPSRKYPTKHHFQVHRVMTANSNLENHLRHKYVAKEIALPNLCGAVSVENIKTLLTEWVNTTKEPSEDDVLVFTDYISAVVRERNLEKLDLIIKCFYKLSKKGSLPWQRVYLSVVDTMQLNMLEIYSSSLKVNVDF